MGEGNKPASMTSQRTFWRVCWLFVF